MRFTVAKSLFSAAAYVPLNYEELLIPYIHWGFSCQPSLLRSFWNTVDNFIRTLDKNTFDGSPILIKILGQIVPRLCWLCRKKGSAVLNNSQIAEKADIDFGGLWSLGLRVDAISHQMMFPLATDVSTSSVMHIQKITSTSTRYGRSVKTQSTVWQDLYYNTVPL